MGFKMVFTERDRKLIIIVSTVAILFIFGWFVIKPLWIQHEDLASKAEELTAQKEYATNPAKLQSVEARTKALHTTIEKILEGFYPQMDAAQVDELTAKLSKRYHTTIENLSIALPSGPAAETTYKKSAPSASDTTNQNTSSSSSSVMESATGATTPAAGDLTGTYETGVQLILTGSRKNLQNFVNGVASDYPGIRVKSFKWAPQTEPATSSAWSLVIDLAIYTYAE